MISDKIFHGVMLSMFCNLSFISTADVVVVHVPAAANAAAVLGMLAILTLTWWL